MANRLLPYSTLEINEAAAFMYGDRVAADACAWYVVALGRWAAAGAPVAVVTLAASIGGSLLQITYPETGEQLAKAAYERLQSQGVPKMALRVRGERDR